MKLNKLIFGLAVLLVTAGGLQAQTNNTAGPVTTNLLGSVLPNNPTIQGGAQEIVDAIGSGSNGFASIYGTYAPNIAAPQKFGGGILGGWNFNNYVGTALGLDWLGQFSMVSANVTLQIPIYPFRNSQIVWLRPVMITPLGIIGAGHPMTGSSSGVSEISDVGGQMKFGHWLGGNFGVGFTWGKWLDAGNYSGTRYHAFLDWSIGI